jgi:DNA-binding transcriptional MerR regulator
VSQQGYNYNVCCVLILFFFQDLEMKSSALRQPPLAAHQAPRAAQEAAISELFTIGELSQIYGVTLRALRFYEQRGLLKPIRKGAARFYDPTQTARLQLILKGKHLGFTLTEIAELLMGDRAHVQPDEFAIDETMVLSQLRHLEERREELDRAITELRATHLRMTSVAI